RYGPTGTQCRLPEKENEAILAIVLVPVPLKPVDDRSFNYRSLILPWACKCSTMNKLNILFVVPLILLTALSPLMGQSKKQVNAWKKEVMASVDGRAKMAQ